MELKKARSAEKARSADAAHVRAAARACIGVWPVWVAVWLWWRGWVVGRDSVLDAAPQMFVATLALVALERGISERLRLLARAQLAEGGAAESRDRRLVPEPELEPEPEPEFGLHEGLPPEPEPGVGSKVFVNGTCPETAAGWNGQLCTVVSDKGDDWQVSLGGKAYIVPKLACSTLPLNGQQQKQEERERAVRLSEERKAQAKRAAEAKRKVEAERKAEQEAAAERAARVAAKLIELRATDDEGTIARDIREGNWLVPKSPAACCGGHLQVAKLRLILCFLHNERLTEDCPLLLMGGRVPETIAANFAPVRYVLWRSARWPRLTERGVGVRPGVGGDGRGVAARDGAGVGGGRGARGARRRDRPHHAAAHPEEPVGHY